MNTPHSLNHVLALVLDYPWALTDSMRAIVTRIMARHLAGDVNAASDFERIERPARQQPAQSSVARIPIHGVIAPRMNLMSDMSGGTSYHQIREQLNAAIANPAVKTIVLDVDSPGGSCAGVTECASAMLAARERKPIVAVAEYQMCSAAYWLASCATEVVASPSAQLGSIGVFSIHEDLSKALDQLGVKLSIISAGKYKTDGNPAEPLSASARARIQQQVDRTYKSFVADVARGRHVSDAAVRSGYGEGSVVDAFDAQRLGMVDRVETLEDTLTRVQTTPPTLQPLRAVPSPPALPPSSALSYYLQQQQARSMKGGRLYSRN